MLRSLGVIVFIAIVGRLAFTSRTGRRSRVARSSAADLVKTQSDRQGARLRRRTCRSAWPEAEFKCDAEFKNGDQRARYVFAIDRDGSITVVEQGETKTGAEIKKTSDPWGD